MGASFAVRGLTGFGRPAHHIRCPLSRVGKATPAEVGGSSSGVRSLRSRHSAKNCGMAPRRGAKICIAFPAEDLHQKKGQTLSCVEKPRATSGKKHDGHWRKNEKSSSSPPTPRHKPANIGSGIDQGLRMMLGPGSIEWAPKRFRAGKSFAYAAGDLALCDRSSGGVGRGLMNVPGISNLLFPMRH